tara:strand:+ start:487 stop:720 length:234 start_codon:yes stop_codon:yes gene_type:complete
LKQALVLAQQKIQNNEVAAEIDFIKVHGNPLNQLVQSQLESITIEGIFKLPVHVEKVVEVKKKLSKLVSEFTILQIQ